MNDMKWNNKGHEFDSVSGLLVGKTDIFIWGFSGRGVDLCETLIPLRKLGLDWTINFIDSDQRKQQTATLGCRVFAPEYLRRADQSKSIVVACASKENTEEIIRQAGALGFVKDQNLFEYDYFKLTLLSVHLVYNYQKVYISTLNLVPSTVCNLNCNACLNFNPFIQEHTVYPVSDLKNSVRTLFGAVDFIGRFQLTGGEPLLYKDLNELISFIGDHYRSQIALFELVTNGTMIPSDETVELLRKYNMRVYLDDYGMSVSGPQYKFREIYYLLKNNFVDVVHNYITEWYDFTTKTEDSPEFSEDSLRAHFDHCGCPFSSLVGTRIASCNYALYSYKAGLSDFYEDEYFDLSTVDDTNKKELVEFRLRYNDKGYVEFCRQCNGFDGANVMVKPAVQLPKRKGN